MRATITQDDLNELHKQEKFLTRLCDSSGPEFKAVILEVIADTIETTRRSWSDKGLAVDDDKLHSFRTAVKSKIDTLNSMRNLIELAPQRRLDVQKELAKYESKGE